MLGLGERVRVQLGRLRQPDALVEDVAVLAVPVGGGLGELVVHAQGVAVGGDPVAQPRPRADERLVRELDVLRGQRDETRGGEPVEHRGVETGAQGAALGVLGPLAECDEAQEDVPRGLPLRRGELGVDGLGGAGDGVLDAADLLVAGQCDGHAAAALPGLRQRVLHERQRGRLAGDVRDQPADQRGLDGGTGVAGGFGDGAAQLVTGHRADQELAALDRLDQFGVPGEVAVEVRADADDDVRRPHEGRHEPVALLRPGEREDLLELVDDQHEARVVLADPQSQGGGVGELSSQRHRGPAGELGEPDRALVGRVHTGREDQRVVEPRQQTGAQQRRLAAARRPEHADERAAPDQVDELRGELLAPEEAVGVLRLERLEPHVRRRTGRRLRRRGDGPPPPFPLDRVAAARLDVGEGDGERGQLAPTGRVGQRGGRVVRLGGQRAVGGLAGLVPQPAEIGGEPAQFGVDGVQGPFCTRHGGLPL
ncbi:hypothetical protein BBK82_24820 [Lentzea guizhouensis]|uniref:Uncharacterized protein n=1 Tax=Lentzea guizhouensis TaxID=1586287 RepID=A0A1B2HM70_9PSEU|nr:hypothetical protein [Lentzea guizhouensis]ANZ38806.1 hypothetical protein BBK82_24820 [Lentzea guizhouensis]